MKKQTRTNLIFTLAVLLAALALFLYGRAHAVPGLVARVQYGFDSAVLDIPLDRDGRYDLDSAGYTIHLEVKDGAVAFVDSPCPDHLCEHYGWLSEEGDWAACLPAQASVTVMAEP